MNGKILKENRKKAGLTQTELSKKIGVSMRTVQNWEADINAIPKSVELFFLNSTNFSQVNPNTNIKYTGYYFPDVSASAGLENGMTNDELTKIPVSIPGWGDDVIFINVFGDSMYPKYNAGEIIGVKSIEFIYLNYGYPYVVVLKNGDVYIKIVQPGSDKEHLSLESTNSHYKPKEFHLENIKSFYSIKGVIKKEMI